MRIASLCSGYGGLDLAVADFFDADVAWHCEYDAAPSKILAHHWPAIPNHHNVRDLALRMALGDTSIDQNIDILTAGYPCQPFSAAGRRQGTNDDRHLWPWIREAIRLLRPKFVVLENVAGHRSLGFDRVLGDLAEDGYDAAWTSIRASDVGAPHHRERLFILAYPAGNGGLTEVLGVFLPTPRVSDSNGVGVHGTGGLDLRTAIDLLPTPQASDGTSGGASHPDKRVKEGGHGMSIRDYALLAEEPSRWGKYEAAIQRWERLTRPAPPPTEPNRNGKPRLNAAFAQWMMGLPDGWVTDVPDLTRADQLKAVGNGVVPQQAFSALGRLWAIATAEQVAA